MLQSMVVRDAMSAASVTFTPETDVLDAIHALVEQRVSGAPVIDAQGNLVGVISERDCLRVTVMASYHGERAGPVREFMSRSVETVDADTSVLDVAQLFLTRPYRRYPVVSDNRLVGIISRRDVLRTLLAAY
jgi:CBS domain-containing protein